MRYALLIPTSILVGWLTSFALPVADTMSNTGRDTATGFTVLAMGWMGPLIGQFGWYANLLLPAAMLIAAKWPSRASSVRVICGLILGALVINSVFWSGIPMDNGDNHIVAYRVGYWLWLASVSAGALWLLANGLKRRPAAGTDQAQPST